MQNNKLKVKKNPFTPKIMLKFIKLLFEFKSQNQKTNLYDFKKAYHQWLTKISIKENFLKFVG